MTLACPGSVALGKTGTAAHALLLRVSEGPCLEAAFGDEGSLPRNISLTV